MSTIPTFALPGDTLAPSNTHTPGPGSHTHASHLFASLAGPVSTTPGSKKLSTLPSVSVAQAHSHSDYVTAIPTVADVVLGRITRTTPRQATLSILALDANGARLLREPFPALIRVQDIRATEIDKVKMSESYRVGDIVRGVVISLGDERTYFVGTGKNEYGVVLARSEAGENMVPVSWREMREVLGGEGQQGMGKVELRKVAKPI